MPIEAELVYRAQDTAGRKDAAYVILMRRDEGRSGEVYQVTFYWGAWDRYQSGALQRKSAYAGPSYSQAQSITIDAANKRTQRGYELQDRLCTFPSWLSDSPRRHNTPTVTIVADDNQLRQALAETQIQAPPEPEPLSTGRVKHTRAGFLEL